MLQEHRESRKYLVPLGSRGRPFGLIWHHCPACVPLPPYCGAPMCFILLVPRAFEEPCSGPPLQLQAELCTPPRYLRCARKCHDLRISWCQRKPSPEDCPMGHQGTSTGVSVSAFCNSLELEITQKPKTEGRIVLCSCNKRYGAVRLNEPQLRTSTWVCLVQLRKKANGGEIV